MKYFMILFLLKPTATLRYAHVGLVSNAQPALPPNGIIIIKRHQTLVKVRAYDSSMAIGTPCALTGPNARWSRISQLGLARVDPLHIDGGFDP